MHINPVQFNINTKSNEHKHYLDAEGAVDTAGLVKPLPGKGHLIHDDFVSSAKYFVKDAFYDMKSLKNGFNGTANDHQLGRLNDVGLQLGGVGIATYLASKTTNPKERIMEYVGLGAFLTAMNIYPKIAINAPSRIIHGYDIGKWYIDDQGRKKSVNQDSNYRPMDLYRGERSDEDLALIADKMGIPRGIKNRDELTKEQTRKLATQNNTLWMLTAGFATPVLAALGCYGLENYIIAPQLAKIRNSHYDKLITESLEKTKNMDLDISKIGANDLSKKVEKLLKNYNGKQIPEDELEVVIDLLSEKIGNNTKEALKEDLKKVISESVYVNSEIVDKMITNSENLLGGSKKKVLEQILVPTKEELEGVIKKVIPDADLAIGATTSPENIVEIKESLRTLIDRKINASNTQLPIKRLNALRNQIINSVAETMENNKVNVLTEGNFIHLTNIAKILGEFKENKRVLDKCELFKFEHAPETVLARSYNKFEKTLIKELDIKMADMKKMRESDDFTKQLLDKKLSEICSDDKKYKEIITSLTKVISEMESNLNGSDGGDVNKSFILDLVNAIENNYNNTAKRLEKISGFENTITRLVNQNTSRLGNSVKTRQELYDLLDGITVNRNGITENFEGLGSSREMDITRIIERYQGVKNSFNRILHTLEIYKRTESVETFLASINPGTLSRTDKTYVETLMKSAREIMLTATSSDHNLKLDTIDNQLFYKDLVNAIWAHDVPFDDVSPRTKKSSFVTNTFKDVLSDSKINNGDILERFKTYITKFRNIIPNSKLDFTKEHHIMDGLIRYEYRMKDKTNMSVFNLVAQTPINMLRKSVKGHYTTKTWVKKVGIVASGVFGATLLAQAGFGKIRNPHNIKKQVNNETN